MFLASTSDILRIVTGQAVSTIGVHASWVDNASGSYTPGRTDTNVTTATTTTVVPSPGASTVRNVRTLSITNDHATSSCVVTIQHFDGTTSVDIEKITLAAGEEFVMSEDGEWRHLSAAGAEYEYVSSITPNLGIAGTIAETIPRELCAEISLGGWTTGQVWYQAIYLKAGMLVSNISLFSATTAAGTPTQQRFGLYSRRGTLLCQSADDTTTAWGANTIKTLAMTTPYRVPVSDVYYIAWLMSATTMPSVKGLSLSSVLSGGGSTATAVIPFVRQTGNGSLTALNDPGIMPAGAGGSPAVWAAIT
jgi:hypothetical protein